MILIQVLILTLILISLLYFIQRLRRYISLSDIVIKHKVQIPDLLYYVFLKISFFLSFLLSFSFSFSSSLLLFFCQSNRKAKTGRFGIISYPVPILFFFFFFYSLVSRGRWWWWWGRENRIVIYHHVKSLVCVNLGWDLSLGGIFYSQIPLFLKFGIDTTLATNSSRLESSLALFFG